LPKKCKKLIQIINKNLSVSQLNNIKFPD